MSALRQALADYLAMRRALGYTLVRSEKLLAQFLTYLEAQGEDHLTTKTALTWAMLPAGADRSWMSARLSVVRRFATHLRGIGPATEVPPCDLLPGRSCRATPYLYSQEDVIALMTATAALRTPHREATYRTLIGLLAVTGMRVGEAIGLDRDDFDAVGGGLTIRRGKSGKTSEHCCGPRQLFAPARSTPPAAEHARPVRLTGRHQAALCERSKHVPEARLSRRHRPALGRLPTTAPRPAARVCRSHAS